MNTRHQTGRDDGVGETRYRNVTHLQYYSHRLAIRPGFSQLHASRKLFLMYVLDAFITVEGNRLHWLKLNQGQIKAEDYSTLNQFVRSRREQLNTTQLNDENTDPEQINQAEPNSNSIDPNIVEDLRFNGEVIGKQIILPSTHIGSERQFTESYRDAMDTVAKTGRPDLFITVTSNSSWREIQENLPSHDKGEFRPDLETRVFKLKLAELIKDIKTNNIFGKAIACIHVIEFQKRGHPHAHIIVTLRQEDKLTGNDVIDQVVCAELPEQNTRLYKIVTQFMLHGPCGPDYLDMICMQNDKKKCSKNFPKEFIEETIITTMAILFICVEIMEEFA